MITFDFIDVDECMTGNHNCHADAECHNTMGSHTCQCVEGFTGTGFECDGGQNIRIF